MQLGKKKSAAGHLELITVGSSNEANTKVMFNMSIRVDEDIAELTQNILKQMSQAIPVLLKASYEASQHEQGLCECGPEEHDSQH